MKPLIKHLFLTLAETFPISSAILTSIAQVVILSGYRVSQY